MKCGSVKFANCHENFLLRTKMNCRPHRFGIVVDSSRGKFVEVRKTQILKMHQFLPDAVEKKCGKNDFWNCFRFDFQAKSQNYFE